MEKYGFVYIWFDKKRKMYYIGSHWGTVNDGYICSSNRMRDAYRRRPNDFKRRILKNNIQRKDLFEEEFNFLSYIKDNELGKKYYNIRKHKWGHWSSDNHNRLSISEKISLAQTGRKLSEKWKKNIGKSLKGKSGRIWTTEQKKKLSEKMKLKESFFKGKKHSEESKRKMSEAAKNRHPNFKGKKHSEESINKIKQNKKGCKGAFSGKKHSEESKRKMRESRKKYLDEQEKNKWLQTVV